MALKIQFVKLGKLTFAKMRQVLAFPLILCLLAQMSVRTMWVVHYQWNKAEYLLHCENKAKPERRCNGKCRLNKKIKASEPKSKEPQLPASFFSWQEITFFFETPGTLLPVWAEKQARGAFPPFLLFPPTALDRSVFHPPPGFRA